MVCVCFDALGRYFFGYNISWVTEITEYSLLYITFLGAAWLLRQERHVTIEIVLSVMNTRSQIILLIITSIFCAFIYKIVFVYGVIVTYDHWSRGIYDPGTLKFPKAAIIAIIPIGSLMLIIQFLRRAYKAYLEFEMFRKGKDKKDFDVPEKGFD